MKKSLNNLRVFKSQSIIGLDIIMFSEVQNPAGQPLSGMQIFVNSSKVNSLWAGKTQAMQ